MTWFKNVFLWIKGLLGLKSEEEYNLSDWIEKFIKLLDYDEKLRIQKMFVSGIKSFIKPMEKGKSRSRNPTFYLINTGKTYSGLCFIETLAIIVTARAVRCRRQSGKDKLQSFPEIFVSKDFQFMSGELTFKTFGNYEADAEIVARIAGEMYEKSVPIPEIAQMILLDASKIVEKYGIGILEESMYITI